MRSGGKRSNRRRESYCKGRERREEDVGKRLVFIKMDTAIILTSSDLMTNLMSKVSLIAGLSGVVSQGTGATPAVRRLVLGPSDSCVIRGAL